jgi:hypothetical protein
MIRWLMEHSAARSGGPLSIFPEPYVCTGPMHVRLFPGDDEYKPVWPSGLWATSQGGDSLSHACACVYRCDACAVATRCR